MITKRSIYESYPFYGRMTQGSIINGCIAEDFPGEDVFGLIVTPRCDLGHEGKVSTVHYVPVVPFERWFEVIAKPIIREQWKKRLANQINTIFRESKVTSGNILDADLSYDDLMLINQEKVSKTKNQEKISLLLKEFFEKNTDADDFNTFLSECITATKSNELSLYLKALEGDKNASFYLIEGWDDYGANKHLVIILRDVRRIQFEIANMIKGGVTESELHITDQLHNDLFLSNDNSNFFWVQAHIKSPFIEHIMQAFIHNFSRIGVEDRPADTIEKLTKTLNSTII